MEENFYDTLIGENEETETMSLEEQIEQLPDVDDKEITESIEAGEKEAKKCGRKKKQINVQADTVVNAFLANKSEENWTALQEFFWYGIKQFAYGYVKNNDDAYDMTIDTFIKAYENIDSYDPNKAKFSTWLWTICRNNCYGFIKAQSKINVIDNDISEIFDSAFKEDAYIQNLSEFENSVFSGNTFEKLSFSDVAKTLYDVSVLEMSRIPGVSGQILHMKLVDGKKIREIAVELSMNESTVKNHLYRGKENLKRILSINHKELVQTYADMNGAIDAA